MKCARTACQLEYAQCWHSQDHRPYCIRCAHLINKNNPEHPGLVVTWKHDTRDGRGFVSSDHKFVLSPITAPTGPGMPKWQLLTADGGRDLGSYHFIWAATQFICSRLGKP